MYCCICELGCIFLTLTVIFTYFMVNSILFMQFHYYEENHKIFYIKNDYIMLCRFMFYVIQIIFFI